MTWEETIISIRKLPEYAELVEKAYFDENLELNVERFRSSLEYAETKKIIHEFFSASKGVKLLDIGSGNGISVISFALDGYEVSSVEPDTSDTVGSGAIRKLVDQYHLSNVLVVDTVGEELPFESGKFDIVYIRQAMHHANDINKFVSEAARVLRKGGLFLTIRDHVIFDSNDKKEFLNNHPLHRFYGGENAFTFEEYKNAMKLAGLNIKKVLKYFDSVINYFPMIEEDINLLKEKRKKMEKQSLEKRLPSFLSENSLVKKIYSRYLTAKLGQALNEAATHGRMYSFISVKAL